MPCPTGDGQPHGHRRPAPWLGAIVALLALAGMLAPAVSSWRNERAAWAGLATQIAQIQPARADARIEACHTWLAQKPLVLMVLGQSNAANHGVRQPGQPPVRVRRAS